MDANLTSSRVPDVMARRVTSADMAPGGTQSALTVSASAPSVLWPTALAGQGSLFQQRPGTTSAIRPDRKGSSAKQPLVCALVTR